MKLVPILLLALLFTLVNCEYDDLGKPVDCGSYHLTLKVVAESDANCGQSNGQIRVSATGGSGNYIFSINNGTPQKDSVFQNLTAGSYVLTVKDNSCTASVTQNILNKNGLNISLQATNADCGSTNGAIMITPSGGVQPVTFSLNAGTFSSSAIFDHLSQGAYTLTAKDATGCLTVNSIKVSSKASFSNDILPIISANCALSGCHNGSNQLPDFRTLKTIQANASGIKSLTGNRSMPQGGVLTQDQIDLIACWVNDAAPDN